MYQGATTVTVLNSPGLSGNISIPQNVNYNNVNYTVTDIYSNAFSSSPGLTSVSIPNSVTSIGSRVFDGCKNLTSIIIPNSVTSTGNFMFESCTALTSVTFPSSLTYIETGTFSNCSSLVSITIPNTVTSIGPYAFDNCISLLSINIPSSVTNIGSYAFGRCYGLTSFTVNWTTPLPIDGNPFAYLILTNITLNVPTGTAAIYDATPVWTDFGTISGVAAPVVLGQKFAVAGINYQVTKATLPYEVAIGANGVNTNGNSGRTTNSLKTGISGAFIIPDTISIDGNSFSVTSILAYAFQNNTGLLTVTVPSSITNIGDFAFSNCSGLTAVNVNATTPLVINSNVFENIILANVTLNTPVGTETAYKAANVWKDFKIATTLGSNSFSLKNNLKFYPNPTQSLITFPQEINNLEVFDVAGKKVKSFKKPSATYDVSNLEKGIYILKGTITEGNSINEKMIKE